MCWSIESSKNAYIIGTLSSLILLIKGNNMYKNIGLFFLAVAQMQLLEYFIWSDQGCGYINNNASKMIVPVLNLQALAMILGSYIFDITILSKSLMSNITIFVVLFEVITSILYLYITRKELVCSLPIKNKGIEWNIGQSNIIGSDVIRNIWATIYFSILFAFPLLWKGDLIKYLFCFIMIGSYTLVRVQNEITWQSRWCFPASIIPVIYVVLMLLGVKK
jgi:hypothetical protein